MTSRREGFGLEFPESMVVGLPVVASKVCGILEIFNPLYQAEQSSLVRPENDELPADAMLKKSCPGRNPVVSMQQKPLCGDRCFLM